MKVLIPVAASAGLYALSFPPFDLPSLAWLALVPLILALRSAPPAVAAGWSGVWAALAAAAVIPWLVPTLHGHFERSLAQSVGLYALICLLSAAPFYAVTLGAWACARPHVPRALGPVLFAAAWVAGEYARAHLGLASPWLKLGDSQSGAGRVRQIADITGVYGVSGLVALANAVAAEVVCAVRARGRGGREQEIAPAAWAVCTLALALCFTLAYGSVRPRNAGAPPTSGLEIVVVHGNENPGLRWRRESAERVLRHYGTPTRDLLFIAGSRPDLIVWPESALQAPIDDPTYTRFLRSWSREAPLLLGAPRRDGALVYNSSFLLQPNRAMQHYDKRRLLAFSETQPLGGVGAIPTQGDLDAEVYSPGTRPGLLALGEAQLGILICLEALYPELARELAAGGASVLLNLSNEGWYRGAGASEQQLAQSVFRAIETRLPLVRATSGGVSALIAPDGATVARIADGARTLVLALPAAWPGPTRYVRWGDAFAQACVAVCVLAILGPLARRVQSQRSTAKGRQRSADRSPAEVRAL